VYFGPSGEVVETEAAVFSEAGRRPTGARIGPAAAARRR